MASRRNRTNFSCTNTLGPDSFVPVVRSQFIPGDFAQNCAAGWIFGPFHFTCESEFGERFSGADAGPRSTRFDALGNPHTRQTEGVGGLLQPGPAPCSTGLSPVPIRDSRSCRIEP